MAGNASLPREFLELIASYNAPALSELPGALLTDPGVSLRLNPAKGVSAPQGADTVEWCPEGVYLRERPTFAFDPAWHQGLYYVQDSSSMFTSFVVRCLTASGRPVRLLDACAAPGGKTTAAIAALPPGSAVVANEFVPSRCAVLRENLAKWGYGEVPVTQGDTARFRDMPSCFDIIMADVPCSGEGMMRKDPEAVAQWSPALIRQCAARQREIVDNLWPALAPGGYLIYSTCTFNREENEMMVDYLVDTLGAENVPLPVDPTWPIEPGIDTPHACCRFIPGRVRGEGLFMAVVRKPVGEETTGEAPRPARKRDKAKEKGRGKAKSPAMDPQVRGWLGCEAEWSFEADTLYARPLTDGAVEWPLPPRLAVATLKGRDYIPTQQLAMSRLLRPGAFPQADVDAQTAIDYLSCRAVTLPADTPRGIVLLTHGARTLGFVKNLGNRANNLYPKPWRILSPDARPAEVLSYLTKVD